MIDPHAALKAIPNLSTEQMAELVALLDEMEERQFVKKAQDNFVAFIKAVETALDAPYKLGTHLKRLISLLEDVEMGTKDRIAVSIAPRFGKSQTISILYPAWYLGRHPDHKVIVASHTADLAVDMARKVRNLMQTPEYKRIFPGVSIASDAKAAGKWDTNKGGTFYACGTGGALAGRGAHLCVLPSTTVYTKERGPVPAESVQVGEHLRSWHGWARVTDRITPHHEATVVIAGSLRVSPTHPIWTYTRGWVSADEICPTDTLWTMTLIDIMMTRLLTGAHYVYTWYESHAGLQHLGTNAAAVHKSEGSQLHHLRRCWDSGMRALGQLLQLLRRHGRAPNSRAHAGQGGPQRELLQGELSVGRHGDAAEQPEFCAEDNRVRTDTISGPVGSQNGFDAGYDLTSGGYHGDDSRAGTTSSTYESQHAARYTAVGGWFRRCAARLLSSSCEILGYPGLRADEEGYLAKLGWQIQNGLGLLLGVRLAGASSVAHHSPQQFVNFTVDGDHTFIGDRVLSHNCIVDDPHSEQDLKSGNFDALDTAYDWFRLGLRTRLMPGGKLCILHTRWSQKDLIGRLTKDMVVTPEADQYEVFEFPAILTDADGAEKSLWPEQWSVESLQRTRASMAPWMWNANYMQNPTARDSSIIKADWIQWWEHDDPPPCDFIVQGWDTALTTKERSDYSVCQTWGVWFDEETNLQHAILLNRSKGKYEFPELKQEAHEQFINWEPDSLIIEAKASGQPLIDELRRSGIYVQDFSPGKGNDKIARLNAVADMFASGQVWFPRRRWAEETVDEILAFPSGEHDDDVDTATLCLMRIRKGGYLPLHTDKHEPEYNLGGRRKSYY